MEKKNVNVNLFSTILIEGILSCFEPINLISNWAIIQFERTNSIQSFSYKCHLKPELEQERQASASVSNKQEKPQLVFVFYH